MPYSSRRGGRSGSRYAGSSALMNVRGGIGNSGDNYKLSGSGIRRHEIIAKIAGLDTIALGDYAIVHLTHMNRTFGVGEDEPPTANASNNFQTASVMNGSKIVSFQADVGVFSPSDMRVFESYRASVVTRFVHFDRAFRRVESVLAHAMLAHLL